MLGCHKSVWRALKSLLFVFVAAKLTAQEYRFQSLGIEQGLTNLAVKTIYQDRKGFLWVSTENGIFRYDGTRFQAFGPDDGIPSTWGAAFGEAPDGGLLVGSDAGLYRQIGNRFEQVPLPGKASVSWLGGVKADGKGNTYVATDIGLMLLAGTLPVAKIPAPAGAKGVATRGIVADKDSIWYACGQEICRLKNGKVLLYNANSGLPAAAWLPVGIAASGELWARGTGSGVATFSESTGTFKMHDTPLAASGLGGTPAIDDSGAVLFPTPDGLAIRGKDGWVKIGRTAGLRGAVYSVLQDREGSLWVGMAGRGLMRWAGYRQWEAYTTDSGLGSDLAYEILPQPGGKLWVATESGLALGIKHGDRYSWSKVPQIGSLPVHSVRAGEGQTLWVGTETRGVARLHPSSGAVTWFSSDQGLDATSAYAIKAGRDRRLWVATEAGVFLAEPPYRRFRAVDDLPRTRFWVIAEDAQGEIWAGGKVGVFHLKAGRWNQFTTSEGLSNDEVLSLGADRNGDIWVGYRFGGEIDRITRNNHVDHVRKQTARNGLVYFLGFDAKNRLWAGTERGVDLLEDGRWAHLDTNDGLVWDDCDLNGFASEPDGSVWIGTSGGLSHYTPRSRVPSPYRSSVAFTKLTLGTKDTSSESSPSVDYLSNRLIARFSTLSFTHANGLSFRYRLSPLFSNWQTTDRSELEFPGLPPGSYRLEIQAGEERGGWSTDTAAFGFEIRPAWFRSWWFVGICCIVPLQLLAIGIKLRIQSMRRREAELLKLVELRTADLRKANEGLVQLSSIDGLTGVANRRIFDQTLEREWARLMRSGEPLSLLLLDVDHFKMLNDSEGHQRGDECLILIASEARRLVKREVDLVARYGGEEFAILLSATGIEDALQFAELVRLSVEKLALSNIHSPVATTVTVSIGVATAVRGSYADIADFVAAADQGLYAAKRAGRNRVAQLIPELV